MKNFFLLLLISLFPSQIRAETLFELALAKSGEHYLESVQALVDVIEKNDLKCKVVVKCYQLWDGSRCNYDPNKWFSIRAPIVRRNGDEDVGISILVGPPNYIGEENSEIIRFTDALTFYEEASHKVHTFLKFYTSDTGYNYKSAIWFGLSKDGKTLSVFEEDYFADWIFARGVEFCSLKPKKNK